MPVFFDMLFYFFKNREVIIIFKNEITPPGLYFDFLGPYFAVDRQLPASRVVCPYANIPREHISKQESFVKQFTICIFSLVAGFFPYKIGAFVLPHDSTYIIIIA